MSNESGGAVGGVRNREQALAEIFVSLADTLVDDYDVVELLDRLVTASVELLGATAAGLLLDDQKGNLAVVASSSEETRLLEVYQLQSNEGPCLDSVRQQSPIASDRLADDRDRWPQFVPAALAAGIRSVVAVPLRLREETIGGLEPVPVGRRADVRGGPTGGAGTCRRRDDRHPAAALRAPELDDGRATPARVEQPGHHRAGEGRAGRAQRRRDGRRVRGVAPLRPQPQPEATDVALAVIRGEIVPGADTGKSPAS